MYKVIHQQTSEEIVILHARWKGRIDTLRQLDHLDLLICPGCERPVRVRAGARKRAHFAHKHLQNCPFAQASPALLAARAELYEWLVVQFGEAVVSVEKDTGSAALPRPFDCWVECPSGSLAYWIIESRLKPEIRRSLKAGFEQACALVQTIFLSELQKPYEKTPDALILTTTEREFMQASLFDQGATVPLAAPGKSLHYLNPQEANLTTYRGMYLIHRPQIHAGLRYSSPLALLSAAPENGEFVHPGEHERLLAYQQEEQSRQAAREEARRLFSQDLSRPADRSIGRVSQPLRSSQPPRGGSPPPEPGFQQKVPGTCLFCGKITRDWWFFDRATGQCKCRECYRQGRA